MRGESERRLRKRGKTMKRETKHARVNSDACMYCRSLHIVARDDETGEPNSLGPSAFAQA